MIEFEKTIDWVYNLFSYDQLVALENYIEDSKKKVGVLWMNEYMIKMNRNQVIFFKVNADSEEEAIESVKEGTFLDSWEDEDEPEYDYESVEVIE